MSARTNTDDALRHVAVVTGTRAEFGLLTPVMRAIEAHPDLQLLTVVAGTHLLGPAHTRTDVERLFTIDAEVPMQREGQTGRLADAAALGRGIEGMATALGERRPDWAVVLGDRIEAMAGAAAASVAGVPVAHIHGGDRAEGIADESIRHAITKLAHVHLAATERSAARIERMGEDAWRIHAVGSPAIDGLGGIEPLGDEAFGALGSPRAVFLMHPDGRDESDQEAVASALMDDLRDRFGPSVLCLHPNHDPGREAIISAIDRGVSTHGFTARPHLERSEFVGLLKRLASSDGVLVGNSSAGLIEAAALRLPVVDVGPRQDGRECPDNVIRCARVAGHAEDQDAILRALRLDRSTLTHPYGDGRSGERIAALLAGERDRARLLRKRCTY